LSTGKGCNKSSISYPDRYRYPCDDAERIEVNRKRA
jgi:hypothetical protein